MCGRFAFFAPREAVLRLFGVEFDPPLEARYNLAPSQPVGAIRAGADGLPQAVRLRWGLVPFWAETPSIGNRMINARIETLAAKPAFRQALLRRRCVILASGFYEWQAADPATGRPKTPCFISAASGEPFAMAGLWERWEKGPAPLETCTIITTEAHAGLREIHHRMPVILPPCGVAGWLGTGVAGSDSTTAADWLAGLAPMRETDLRWWAVSRAVNRPAEDSPELIRPLAAPA